MSHLIAAVNTNNLCRRDDSRKIRIPRARGGGFAYRKKHALRGVYRRRRESAIKRGPLFLFLFSCLSLLARAKARSLDERAVTRFERIIGV